MKILGTGLSGLVGSRITELLSPDFSFENLSLETGVDITKKEDLDTYFSRSDAPWVFHFAAYTDVQAAEREKALGEHSLAWKINVTATQNIVDNCRKMGKKLLYIDTDYAFDGKKRSYTEEDLPNPLSWYGKTKYEGARRVLALGTRGLVIRIANPYRAHPVGLAVAPGKKDFVHKMLERLEKGQPITGARDQLFSPTFIDDIAGALRALIDKSAYGVYHVVGSNPLSPYDAALTVADVFGYDRSLVAPTSFKEMFQNRAPVPQYAALDNRKIRALGVAMHTFKDGLLEVKKQEQQGK